MKLDVIRKEQASCSELEMLWSRLCKSSGTLDLYNTCSWTIPTEQLERRQYDGRLTNPCV